MTTPASNSSTKTCRRKQGEQTYSHHDLETHLDSPLTFLVFVCVDRHFAALDAEHFEKLWLICEDEVKALAHRALETDRIIHEQQLGLAWVSLPVPFMERSGPIKQQTIRTATQAAADTLQEETRGHLVEESEGLENTGGGVNRRTVKRIMELLCDEMVSVCLWLIL